MYARKPIAAAMVRRSAIPAASRLIFRICIAAAPPKKLYLAGWLRDSENNPYDANRFTGMVPFYHKTDQIICIIQCVFMIIL